MISGVLFIHKMGLKQAHLPHKKGSETLWNVVHMQEAARFCDMFVLCLLPSSGESGDVAIPVMAQRVAEKPSPLSLSFG